MRILELPFELCPDGQLSVAVLNERPDALSVAQQIYLGVNYSFADGTVAPTSYILLTAHNRFAQRGTLTADYSANTRTIDEVGFAVQLQGVDTSLDEQTAFNALADEFLAIVDDEILSVSAVTIAAEATYQLQLVRSRFGTVKAAHAQGADVYLIRKADLLALQHPSFKVGSELSFKVVVKSGSLGESLEDVDAVTYTVAGTIFTSIAPSNLRINLAEVNPAFAAASPVRIDWSLPDLRGSVRNVHGVKIRTVVEILSDDGATLLWRKLTFGNLLVIASAKMTSLLAGRASFMVRITTDVLGDQFRLTSAPKELVASTGIGYTPPEPTGGGGGGGGGGGSQTPLLSDIDAAGFSFTALGTLSFTNTSSIRDDHVYLYFVSPGGGFDFNGEALNSVGQVNCTQVQSSGDILSGGNYWSQGQQGYTGDLALASGDVLHVVGGLVTGLN